MHFLTSCNPCLWMERVLESPGKKDFWAMENPGIWSLQVLESPGKKHFNVCMNPVILDTSTLELQGCWPPCPQNHACKNCVGLDSLFPHLQQGVALTDRNCTGPPCSVSRPTAHAAGGWAGRPTRRQRYRRQTTTNKLVNFYIFLFPLIFMLCKA